MSASLVGSEMCIRDSGPALALRAASGLSHSALVVKVLKVVWEPAAPVSYTHLTLPTICSV
eukprot:1011060-Alexandrium_andersonii.AAC.1